MSVTTTVATPQTAQAGEQTGGGAGSTPTAQPESGGIQFTPEQQTAIDRLITERLARQKATIEGQTNAAREKSEREAAEQKAKEQGEYQKLAESEKQRAEAAEQKAKEIEERTRTRIVRSEIRSVATEMQFSYPDDVPRLIDAEAITFDDEGEPTNIKALLTQLAKDRPLLIAGAQQGGNAAIPRTPNGTTITQEQFREQEKERALRSGRYAAL